MVLRKSVYIGSPIDLLFIGHVFRIFVILFSQLKSSLPTTIQMSKNFAFWSDQTLHKKPTIPVDQCGRSIYVARFFLADILSSIQTMNIRHIYIIYQKIYIIMMATIHRGKFITVRRARHFRSVNFCRWFS